MAQIFLSYAKKDIDRVRPIHGALLAEGYDVWWDTNLIAGDEWDAVIERELHAARCVVVVWSRTSVRSRWVKAEADEGIGKNALVPISLDGTPPPLGRRHIQAADLSSWKGEASHPGWQTVLKGLRRLIPAPAHKGGVSPEPDPPPPQPRPVPGVEVPEMVRIEPGDFVMGSPTGEKGRFGDEGPRHPVRIASAFELGRTPVTRGAFMAFVADTGHDMGDSARVWTGSKWEDKKGAGWLDPGFAQTDAHPVVCINWHDAVAYCEWLSARTGLSYRLPSEAEWEYACRAGTDTAYWWGDRWDAGKANGESAHNGTTEPGRFPANPWGLLDMTGNVWEWCADHWHDSYRGAPVDGLAWVKDGDPARRVLRGGSWYLTSQDLRSACRLRNPSDNRSYVSGVRLARTL